MIRLNRDYFENPVVPSFVLTKANREYIGNGTLFCTKKTYTKNFSDLDEISFTVNLYNDGEMNPNYEAIDVMKYILVPEVGFFYINSVDVESEGTEFESKNVTAKSYEGLIAQKYLELFVINEGTTESIDGVQFYNMGDKSHSLLHLALLDNCPDWKIGHIDTELTTMQRSFEVSKQDIYSFLTNDVATAFECFFIFDTINLEVNIYKTTNYGVDTNIHVSYNNLLKNVKMNCSTDDIKTCMTLTGSDDLNIREINFGNDKIYNFDYYNSTEYWSQSLYDAYNAWVRLREENIARYNALLADYQKANADIAFLTYEKLPEDPDSKDWTEYGYNPLKEKQKVYEQKQTVSMKAGHGSKDSQFYETEYLPIYNDLTAINAQLDVISDQLDTMKANRDELLRQMTEISALISMERNFTEEQLKELTAFIRETDLSSDNYVVTDVMTEEERIEMLNAMLQFGTEELAKVATPQLSFNADMLNLFNLQEFDVYSGEFDVGNYIWVTLRDDYSIKAKLLTINFDFYDINSFSVTFGNIMRKAKNVFTDIQDAINVAQSAATSVSFNQSHWSQAAKETDNIGQMIADGLLSAGNYLSSGADSEMIIDSRGIFVNTTSGEYANKDSIYIGGGRILFTDDNWKTVSEAIGRVDINGESVFGVIAQAVIAGYIGGSTVVGGTITGTNINNGNGTFVVDANGNLTASSATISGTIKATEGAIGCDANGSGGFIIKSNKIYNGKEFFTAANNGIYIGTDGISLGYNSNSKGANFSVTNTGELVARTGTIGGATIGSDSLSSSNGNWSINSNGNVTFKSGSIGGATIASTSISASSGSNGWSINNDGSASFSKLTITGDALTTFQNIAAGQITADRIKATNVLADYATVTELNGVNAKFSNLNADNITSGTVKTAYLDVGAITTNCLTVGSGSTGSKSVIIKNGKIQADSLDVDSIIGRIANVENLITQNINIGNANRECYIMMYHTTSSGIISSIFRPRLYTIGGKSTYILASN